MKRQMKIVTTPADPLCQLEYLTPIYVTRDGVTKFPVCLVERNILGEDVTPHPDHQTGKGAATITDHHSTRARRSARVSELAWVNVSATPEDDKTDLLFSVSLTAMKQNGTAAAHVTNASAWAGTWRLA